MRFVVGGSKRAKSKKGHKKVHKNVTESAWEQCEHNFRRSRLGRRLGRDAVNRQWPSAVAAMMQYATLSNTEAVTLQMAKEGKPEEKDREIEIPNKLPAPSNTSNAPALTGTEPAQRQDINYAAGGPSAQGH